MRKSREGIVNGTSEKTFAPYDEVTREQLAAFLYRYMQYKDADVSIGKTYDLNRVSDRQKISSWAKHRNDCNDRRTGWMSFYNKLKGRSV